MEKIKIVKLHLDYGKNGAKLVDFKNAKYIVSVL